jgi:hypothetical protein
MQREKASRRPGMITTCGRWAEFYPQIPEFRISDAFSEPESNNLRTSSAGEPAALQVGKNFCGHRFFRIENRVRGKTVNSNRDQDIALENMQHCHAGLVRTEDGFITKTVDTSRFDAIGGEHGKHCLSKMRRGFSPRIENVEHERLIAFDRMVTPLRIVVATRAVLGAAFGSLTDTPRIFSASDLVMTFGTSILSPAVAERTPAQMMIKIAKPTIVLLIKCSP